MHILVHAYILFGRPEDLILATRALESEIQSTKANEIKKIGLFFHPWYLRASRIARIDPPYLGYIDMLRKIPPHLPGENQILKAEEKSMDWNEIQDKIFELISACESINLDKGLEILKNCVEDWKPSSKKLGLTDEEFNLKTDNSSKIAEC